VAQMFRITLSAILALAATAVLLATNAHAQSGLRFNPGAFTPGLPYATSNSILDSMPAPSAADASQPDSTAAKPDSSAKPPAEPTATPSAEPTATPSAEPSAKPAAASAAQTTTPADTTEATIHQGLSPEKANSAGGLSLVRGLAPTSPPVSADVSTSAQNPYLAPSPYTTPRSPGGGLKIR